jgi:Glycosyltransferase family 87
LNTNAAWRSTNPHTGVATAYHLGMPGRLSRTVRVVLFPFLAVQALFPAMWLISVFRNRPATGDWHHLKTVADHFMAGDWSRLYAVGEQALDPHYFWRYPPFALYLVAPLAFLPDMWAYWVLVGTEVIALAVSLWLLRRMEPFRDMRPEWFLAIVLSAPMLSTIVTGQSSALIMLCIVGAASLWTRGRVTHACAVLGLLAIKPNWGIVFGLLAITRREWKGATAMAGVAVLLCALSLPLGFQLWKDFFGISVGHSLTLAGYQPQKLITLRAFLEGTLGKGDLTLILWAIAAAALIVAAVLAWRAPGSPLRYLGIGVLLAVAANPYAFFYDALVLAIPATVWWAERDRWARKPWLVVGVLLALTWCSEQWLYSWGVVAVGAGVPWRPPVSIVGLTTSIWLVLAAREAVRPRPTPPTWPITSRI